MKDYGYIGYERFRDNQSGWSAWAGPVHIIKGTAWSIWIWKLLVTIDTYGDTINFDWDPK